MRKPPRQLASGRAVERVDVAQAPLVDACPGYDVGRLLDDEHLVLDEEAADPRPADRWLDADSIFLA
jgi:hypothetical protein